MGTRTTFSLYTYCNNDVNNLCCLIPSIKWKYFRPNQIQEAIIDERTFDIQKAFKDVSGWEGDHLMNYSAAYLPTIVLLEGDRSNLGSWVFLFLKEEEKIAIRCFTFNDFKTCNISKVEEELGKEIEGHQSEESKKVLNAFSGVVSEILDYERKS